MTRRFFTRVLSAADVTYLYNSSYYAQIQNLSTLNLRDGSSTSANIIKALPADWVVHVDHMVDGSGSFSTANGYHWYQVTDPTDRVSGWMAGENASGTTQYLEPYDSSQQAAREFASDAEITVGTSTDETGDYVLSAIDNYYNNSSTVASLYTSNDQSGTSGQNDVSILKQRGFPEKVILAIAAWENGGSVNGYPLSLNNEDISSDYGHGEMQVTFSAGGGWDNRGLGSGVTIPPCGLASNSYTIVIQTRPVQPASDIISPTLTLQVIPNSRSIRIPSNQFTPI
jgi:hypothetical protein